MPDIRAGRELGRLLLTNLAELSSSAAVPPDYGILLLCIKAAIETS
jgi:hypothetical protein